MALILKDRVKEITTTTGTGDISLGGADSTFEAFSSYMADGDTTYYVIATQESGVDEWEVGIGTWNTGNTLSRTTVLAGSNGTSAVNFGTGDKSVFMSYPASKAVYLDGNGDIDINGGTIDGTAIGSTTAAEGSFTSLSASGNVDLEGYIDMNPIAHPTHAEGRVYYDNTHKTLSYQSDITDVEHELGIEEHVRVFNNTGSTIAKGKPVYWSGNQNDVPTIDLANATSETKYNMQGLTAGEIANNSYGYVIVSGLVTDIDTSSLNAGDNVFLGLTDGALQNASPTYPNFPMCLGWVVKSDATTGIILVNQQNHSVNSFRVRTSAHIGDNLIIGGDLTVLGTQTIASAENVSIANAWNYFNSGDTIGALNTNFSGTGLNDASFTGHFTGPTTTTYYVRIDGVGTGTGGVDTFEWSTDNFATTVATGVDITGDDQLIHSTDNIAVKFEATTGHTSGDTWTGTATPLDVDTGFATNRNTGTSGVGYTHMGIYFDVSTGKWTVFDEYDPEPEGTIDTSDASFSYGTLKAGTFEGDLSGNVTGNVTGTASSASALATARNIGGVSFDGTADINLPGVNTTGNQDTTGNAATATALETARTIQLSGDVTGSVTFDGSADVSITAAVQDDSHAHVISNVDGLQTALDAKADKTTTITSGDYLTGGGDLSSNRTLNVDATSLNTASKVVARDASGDFAAGTITAALSGNASTASALETARDISLTGAVTGSVSFDGSGNVSITTTATSDPTLTLAGDASGSATFTDLGNATLTVTVADDSHNHIISNIDGLQTALDGKLGTTAKAADSNLLDGIDSGSFLRSDANDTYTGLLSLGDASSRIVGSDGFPLVQVNSSRAYFGSTSRGVTTLASNSSTGLKANVSGTDYTVWHAGNDGSGSGLDADTLDGVQGSSYLRSDADDTFTGDIVTTSTNGIRFGNANQTDTNDGFIAAGRFSSGLNIVGTQTSSGTGRQVRVWGDLITNGGDSYWHSGNDGSGSGLDADTVDGIQASSFLRSDADDTSSGNITISNATPTLKFTDTDNNYDATIQGLSGSLVLTADSGAEFGTETIQFNTGGSEAARIDASGNLLVGTTDALPATNNDANGIALRADGNLMTSRSGAVTARFNRGSTDGSIVEFHKDGSTVGSIGTFAAGGGNNLTIGGGGTRLMFLPSSDAIIPRGTSDAVRDGIINLGTSSNRFKELHLTGDIFTSGNVKCLGTYSGASTGYNYMSGGNATNDGANIFVYGSTSSTLPNHTLFRTGSTERARISSTGDVFIAKTTSSYTTPGVELLSTGRVMATADSTYPLAVNRESNDGVVITISQDGATIGEIGTNGNSMDVGAGLATLRFNPAAVSIYPMDGVSGNNADNALDIGYSTVRFRNLYLAGSISDGTNSVTVADLASGGGGGGGIDPLNVYATYFSSQSSFGIGNLIGENSGMRFATHIGTNINVDGFDSDNSVAVGSYAIWKGRHYYSVAIGTSALARSSTSNPYYNTAVGTNAGVNQYSGDYNVYVGTFSDTINTSGSYGIAVGYNSRTTSNSTCVGAWANYSGSSTGFYNTYMGYRAGYDNDGGDYNIAIGYRTNDNGGTGGNQCFVGSYAGFLQSSGSLNTAIGTNALYFDETGSQNVVVGANAAYGQRGSNNTLIGYTAGRPTSNNNYSNTNVICLGHEATSSSGTVTNEITLGNSSISSLRCNTTSISSLSDERDKTDIQDLNWGLDFINDLRPVSFTWNRRDGTMGATKQVGFIAQEVHEVEMNHSSTEYTKMVNYENPSKLELAANQSYPILVKAVQELSAKIEELEARLAQLEGN